MTDQTIETTTTTETADSAIELKPHHIAALGKALMIYDDDQKAGKGGGWGKPNAIGGLRNCDELEAIGLYQAAPENKNDPDQRHNNRFRITEDGIAALVAHYQPFADDQMIFFAGDEVELAEENQPPFVTQIVERDGGTGRYTVKGRSGKYWPVEFTLIQRANPDAVTAYLTSPEAHNKTLDAVRAAAAVLDDDDGDDAPPDFTPTPLEETIAEIENIIYDAIGKQVETDSQGAVDNVQALADAYAGERGKVAVANMTIGRLESQINALKLEIDQSRHALPLPNELTDLRAQVARLEEENARLAADLRTAQTRKPAAPTIPEVDVKLICEDVSHPGGRMDAALTIENYINQGWTVKHEQAEGDNYYVRLERNKPAQPDQPTRAAAEASIPVSAPAGVTVVEVPDSRTNNLIIRHPDPAAVPMNNSPSPCLERGLGGEVDSLVDLSDYSEALDKLMAGQITPAQFAQISDRRALTVGFNAYRQAVTS